MKRLPFFFVHRTHQGGYTLAELCVVLAICATTVSLAAPALGQWFWRLRVEAAVQTWASDLQSARLQALRRGELLQLQRLSHCLNTPLPTGDWRCGWQLTFKSGRSLFSSPLAGELQVQLYPSQNSLDITPLGEAVAGGLRLVVQPRGSQAVVRSICINTTGRLRVVSAGSCT